LEAAGEWASMAGFEAHSVVPTVVCLEEQYRDPATVAAAAMG